MGFRSLDALGSVTGRVKLNGEETFHDFSLDVSD